MKNDIYLSKIALAISVAGNINLDDIDPTFLDLSDLKNCLELLNVLFISHKKRYFRCFTVEQRIIERSLLVSNYSVFFDAIHESFVSTDLMLSIFDFIVCENLRSTQFREVIIHLMECLPQCVIPEIKNAMLAKLMRIIIQLGLYGEDPFNSVLDGCVKLIDCDLISDAVNFTFLE